MFTSISERQNQNNSFLKIKSSLEMNNGMTPFLYTLAVNTHFMTVPLGIVLSPCVKRDK
jgi:hypothetical protein